MHHYQRYSPDGRHDIVRQINFNSGMAWIDDGWHGRYCQASISPTKSHHFALSAICSHDAAAGSRAIKQSPAIMRVIQSGDRFHQHADDIDGAVSMATSRRYCVGFICCTHWRFRALAYRVLSDNKLSARRGRRLYFVLARDTSLLRCDAYRRHDMVIYAYRLSSPGIVVSSEDADKTCLKQSGAFNFRPTRRQNG